MLRETIKRALMESKNQEFAWVDREGIVHLGDDLDILDQHGIDLERIVLDEGLWDGRILQIYDLLEEVVVAGGDRFLHIEAWCDGKTLWIEKTVRYPEELDWKFYRIGLD